MVALPRWAGWPSCQASISCLTVSPAPERSALPPAQVAVASPSLFQGATMSDQRGLQLSGTLPLSERGQRLRSEVRCALKDSSATCFVTGHSSLSNESTTTFRHDPSTRCDDRLRVPSTVNPNRFRDEMDLWFVGSTSHSTRPAPQEKTQSSSASFTSWLTLIPQNAGLTRVRPIFARSVGVCDSVMPVVPTKSGPPGSRV